MRKAKLGKFHSIEHKKKQSKAMKEVWKRKDYIDHQKKIQVGKIKPKRTLEVCKKLSAIRKKEWQNEKYRQKQISSHIGKTKGNIKPHSKQAKKNKSIAAINRWKSPSFRKKFHKAIARNRARRNNE